MHINPLLSTVIINILPRRTLVSCSLADTHSCADTRVQADLSGSDVFNREDNEDGQDSESFRGAGPDPVVPCENGEFVQLCDQISAVM
jgi:hypothetical protein